LLKDLCRVAHACLIEFLHTSLGPPEGVPRIVLAIDTFGEYLDKKIGRNLAGLSRAP
jgi:hypothetical protein